MLQLNLTRQEKNVLLVIIFATFVGMGVSFLFKTIPSAGKIYAQSAFKKPARVNINTADKKQLMGLPGIGPKTAERIIDFRLKNGKFSEVKQLEQVNGIGPKKLEKIRHFITF